MALLETSEIKNIVYNLSTLLHDPRVLTGDRRRDAENLVSLLMQEIAGAEERSGEFEQL